VGTLLLRLLFGQISEYHQNMICKVA